MKFAQNLYKTMLHEQFNGNLCIVNITEATAGFHHHAFFFICGKDYTP